jgi:hypothetical protein
MGLILLASVLSASLIPRLVLDQRAVASLAATMPPPSHPPARIRKVEPQAMLPAGTKWSRSLPVAPGRGCGEGDSF